MTGYPPHGPAAGDYLRLSALRYPDRACYVTGDGTRQTFAATNSRVNRLADALLRRGVGKGDRLAIFANNSVGYAEVLLASLKLGTVYTPLNNRLTTAEVATLLGQAAPKVLFLDARYRDVLMPALTDASHPIQVVLLHDQANEAAGELTFEALVAEGHDREPDAVVDDEDIVGLAFTSGTTGSAKGVLQSMRMLRNMVTAITLDYEVQPDEFRYSSSPLFHIGGQSTMLMHVWRGFPTLLLPAFDADTVLRWMQSGELTGCFLVPTMISTLLNHPDATAGDYSRLRSIIYGAAPMPPSVLRRAISVFDCEFVNAFGAGTEAGLQTVLGSAEHKRAAAGAEHLLGSIGRPAWGVDLRLVDEDDNDVPRGDVGEIITRNGQTMSGYLDRPDATAAALRDGWFRAGDLAYQDDEGYLYLAGRRNDMIIRGGENIYPIEVEDTIASHPDVAEAAVVGRDDEHWGEVVVAFVVPEPGTVIEAEALRAHCRVHLAAYKVPTRFVEIEALPLNASGKVMRRTLREQLAGEIPPVQVGSEQA